MSVCTCFWNSTFCELLMLCDLLDLSYDVAMSTLNTIVQRVRPKNIKRTRSQIERLSHISSSNITRWHGGLCLFPRFVFQPAIEKILTNKITYIFKMHRQNDYCGL